MNIQAIDWLHAGPPMAAGFLASLVEAVEAMTIVLAAGTVRGWRSALLGTAAGLALLFAIVAMFGKTIASVPIEQLQVLVGTLLLLFGIRWLRKAMLRWAGVIDLRDEDALFAAETRALGARAAGAGRRWDPIAFVTTFKAVLLEGTEVVVIVIGLGAAGNRLVPASLGALAACLLVIAAGALLHRPLARVPENALKFAVGVMVSAFGLFWFGEGLGMHWPYGDAAILALMLILLVSCALVVSAIRLARGTHEPASEGNT
jgi:uncharacterized membrane protein